MSSSMLKFPHNWRNHMGRNFRSWQLLKNKNSLKYIEMNRLKHIFNIQTFKNDYLHFLITHLCHFAWTWLLFNFLNARLQTGRIMVWWCPSGSPSGSPSVRPSDSPSVRSSSAHLPHFSPTCFDILSWNFAHDFVLMYYRSSSTVVTLRQFLKELCLFLNLEYR